jgi:hypothetical protein
MFRCPRLGRDFDIVVGVTSTPSTMHNERSTADEGISTFEYQPCTSNDLSKEAKSLEFSVPRGAVGQDTSTVSQSVVSKIKARRVHLHQQGEQQRNHMKFRSRMPGDSPFTFRPSQLSTVPCVGRDFAISGITRHRNLP